MYEAPKPQHINETLPKHDGEIFLRTAHNYDRNQASDESGLECKDASRTQQSFAEEVDINNMLKRFGIGYELPTNFRMPQYGDFDTITTMHEAMNAVTAATEEFNNLPANIRAEFHNSPAEFHDAALRESNRARFEELGLLKEKEPPPVPPAPNVTPPATPPVA